MYIILCDKAGTKPKRLKLQVIPAVALLSVGLLALCILTAAGGFELRALYGNDSEKYDAAIRNFTALLEEQRERFAELEARTVDEKAVLARRIGELQARATRLEAMGRYLTSAGGLDVEEFDFGESPALGGPIETMDLDEIGSVSLENDLSAFETQLANQERQLDVLIKLLRRRELDASLVPSLDPVNGGNLVSRYGRRLDPFTGKRAMHYGLDFSGKTGDEIRAVAGGVVTWSGRRGAYGNLVEIDHGNGYATRYAHNKENLVELGDRVLAGDVIAKMGSTGRSTGSHLHFEVLEDGKRIDPQLVLQ